jgi:hypothetical protein
MVALTAIPSTVDGVPGLGELASDVAATTDQALAASGLDQVTVVYWLGKMNAQLRREPDAPSDVRHAADTEERARPRMVTL